MINDGTHSYKYDAENRIIAVDGGATATYVYDVQGRRVRKTVGGAWTDYIYDLGGNVVTEYTSAQGTCAPICWATSYLYLNGRLTAEYKDGTTYFVHKDHLGSTRLLTKMDKTLKDSMDYLPYGEQIAGDTGTTHKFTGKERDSETGLDYFGARYYSNGLGRFLTPDWAAKPTAVPYAHFGNPQSLNLYSYVRNLPIMRFDADGHQDEQPAWKRFATAMKNLISVKTEVGVGVKISGSIAGVKVSGGSGVSTQTKTYPLGDHPTEITPKAESAVSAQVGPVNVTLKSTAPTVDPNTGKVTPGGTSGQGGLRDGVSPTPNTNASATALTVKSIGEISVVGATAQLGPVGGGAEVVINTPQLTEATKTFFPALGESIGILLGFGSDGGGKGGSGSLPNNPFPGLRIPTPDNPGGQN
jgi:RHS repeat-associated protein